MITIKDFKDIVRFAQKEFDYFDVDYLFDTEQFCKNNGFPFKQSVERNLTINLNFYENLENKRLGDCTFCINISSYAHSYPELALERMKKEDKFCEYITIYNDNPNLNEYARRDGTVISLQKKENVLNYIKLMSNIMKETKFDYYN